MNWCLSDYKVHVALYENIVLEHGLLNLFSLFTLRSQRSLANADKFYETIENIQCLTVR